MNIVSLSLPKWPYFSRPCLSISSTLFSHFKKTGFTIRFRFYFVSEQVDADDMIPLHAGSVVYVSKTDLVRICDPKPSVYTTRLATLLFGHDLLRAGASDNLEHLNHTKMKSLISKLPWHSFRFAFISLIWFVSLAAHVTQIFQRRRVYINENIIRDFIRKHISTLRETLTRNSKRNANKTWAQRANITCQNILWKKEKKNWKEKYCFWNENDPKNEQNCRFHCPTPPLFSEWTHNFSPKRCVQSN